jgi:hypothetical protein
MAVSGRAQKVLFRVRSAAFPRQVDSFSAGFCTGPMREFPREIREFPAGFADCSRIENPQTVFISFFVQIPKSWSGRGRNGKGRKRSGIRKLRKTGAGMAGSTIRRGGGRVCTHNVARGTIFRSGRPRTPRQGGPKSRPSPYPSPRLTRGEGTDSALRAALSPLSPGGGRGIGRGAALGTTVAACWAMRETLVIPTRPRPAKPAASGGDLRLRRRWGVVCGLERQRGGGL